MNKRAVLVLGSVLAASFISESALCKPNQTTKYTYYTISGDTPGAIYSTLVKRGPRVGGVKAYAATTAVSSQSGQLIPGKFCSLEDYKFKIDFTIKLPKLKMRRPSRVPPSPIGKSFQASSKSTRKPTAASGWPAPSHWKPRSRPFRQPHARN